MPARWVPLLYLGFAHLCLIAATAAVALDPRAAGGFFYHPRAIALVHLVALGFVGASILGSIYLVGPLALRVPLPARRADHAAFGAFATGVVGMVAAFDRGALHVVPWLAVLPISAIVRVGARLLPALRRPSVPREARLPIALAFGNLLAAVLLGVTLAVNKGAPFLPVAQLDGVLAHAHLAVVGWAVLLATGVAYRMLPMVFPSAMPAGALVSAGTIALELGVLSLAATLLGGGRGAGASALVVAVGVALFLSHVVWMLRHRRPAPAERRRPDLAAAHVLQSLGWLAAATALGVWLAWSERSEATLRGALAYGVAGLLGFLAQLVIGVEGRLVPLAAWLWGFADRGHARLPPSLHTVSLRPAEGLVFALWTIGVPALAAGLAFDRFPLARLGAAALAAAAAASLLNGVVTVRRLWCGAAREVPARSPSPPSIAEL
jgi:hypothetical protein